MKRLKTMKLIKCNICGHNVKTPDKSTYIRHCNVQQPIKSDNWLNEPSKSFANQKPPQEPSVKEEKNTARDSTDVSDSAPTQEPAIEVKNNTDQPVAVQVETPAPAASQAPESKETSDMVVEDEKNIEEPEKLYKYKCLGCNSFFDALINDACPNCKKEDVDVEVLSDE